MAEPVLDLIDLDQDLPGQREFISCWVSREEGWTFLVDPGPPASTDRLLARLQEMGLEQLDYILLTHIHLDHAGGTGLLLAAYPEAKVVCHERAIAHLVDPARLWQGSQAVLSSMATVYGEPQPVPPHALTGFEEIAARGIHTIVTPGHAPHHISFLHAGTLFCGEAAGTYKNMVNGSYYLRPATPPRFVLEPALMSLTRLQEIEPPPERIAFAHHGLARGDVRELLQTAHRQLRHWVQVARQEGARSPATFQQLFDNIHERLLEEDPHYGWFRQLAPDIQEREYQFVGNTLEGILGYIDSNYI